MYGVDEIKDFVLYIRSCLIQKLSHKYKEFKIYLPISTSDFKRYFEVADEFKVGNRSQKMNSNFKTYVADINYILHAINYREKFIIIMEHLRPRIGFLFELCRRHLDKHQYEFEYKSWKEIIDIVIRLNENLIFKEVKKNVDGRIDLNDVLQQGYVGMLKALQRYNWSSNIKLSTYASYWIREQVFEYVKNNYIVKYDHNVKSVYRQLLKLCKDKNVDIRTLTVDDVRSLFPDLYKKYDHDTIEEVLQIDWYLSLDYVPDEDDSKPYLLDHISYNLSMDQVTLHYSDFIEKVREEFGDKASYILINEFNIPVYVSYHIDYTTEDVKKLLSDSRLKELVLQYFGGNYYES